MILGLFTVLLVGGIISEALGWPFVFYIFGKLFAGSWVIQECAFEFCAPMCTFLKEESQNIKMLGKQNIKI